MTHHEQDRKDLFVDGRAPLHESAALSSVSVFCDAAGKNEVNMLAFCKASVDLYDHLKDRPLGLDMAAWLDAMEAIAIRYSLNVAEREYDARMKEAKQQAEHEAGESQQYAKTDWLNPTSRRFKTWNE